jgi:ABC-2 type transport system permease protein
MTTLAFAAQDSATMTRRSLRHVMRYPVTRVVYVVVPVMLLLLFTGVFGSLRSSLGAVSHSAYLTYVVPGNSVMTAAYGSSVTAQSINRDSTEGIIDRFRTMAITHASVLNGHVISALSRTLLSVFWSSAFWIDRFRPTADTGRWLRWFTSLPLLVLALTWLAVPFGLAAKTAEGLSWLRPHRSAAAVHQQRSCHRPDVRFGALVRAHQPFTPVIDTLRGLLTGTADGGTALAAVAWCAGIALAGYLWARVLFRRDISR